MKSAPFWNPQSKTGEKRTWPKQPRKGENERSFSSSSLPSTSAKGGCEEKLTRMKIEYAYDIWSPLHRFGIHNRKLDKEGPGQNNPEKVFSNLIFSNFCDLLILFANFATCS